MMRKLIIAGLLAGLPAAHAADYDGDGYDDLAVYGPNANDSGTVRLVPGTDHEGWWGYYAENRHISQGSIMVGPLWQDQGPALPETQEAGDRFGQAMASGDFNGDGHDDLAIGAPFEARNGLVAAGVVHVLYATGEGLVGAGNQLWHPDTAGVIGTAESNEFFGSALAAGDFDGDGYDDLAIGAPGESIGTYMGAGSVNILYGSVTGLTASGDQQFWQDAAGVLGTSEAFDLWGSALAADDFDGDGYDDLVIGAPGEDNLQGSVQLMYGSALGITTDGDVIFKQGAGGMAGTAENGDQFGATLATGDLNGDGYADLVIGVPHEDNGEGAVGVMYGAGFFLTNRLGLSVQGNQFWSQDSAGIGGSAETEDGFGSALAVGDFNGDGYDDLAVGVPGEDQGDGAVNVIYGSFQVGLTSAGDVLLDHSDDPTGPNEAHGFGAGLAAGDYNGDGIDDLAIGLPGVDSVHSTEECHSELNHLRNEYEWTCTMVYEVTSENYGEVLAVYGTNTGIPLDGVDGVTSGFGYGYRLGAALH